LPRSGFAFAASFSTTRRSSSGSSTIRRGSSSSATRRPDEDDARHYLAQGPIDMYARLGFGLYLAELRDGGVPIGICGLIKRESLADVDIGFAYLPEFRGKGMRTKRRSP
jgi:RimJ/RimL family protein N-acetyltransferase